MRRTGKIYRHWKQQFDPNAEFVFRKAMTYGDTDYEVGDLIPEDLKNRKYKLRGFWENHLIELAEFEDPSKQETETEDEFVVVRSGSWYTITAPDGEEFKARGIEERDKLLAHLKESYAEKGRGDE